MYWAILIRKWQLGCHGGLPGRLLLAMKPGGPERTVTKTAIYISSIAKEGVRAVKATLTQ